MTVLLTLGLALHRQWGLESYYFYGWAVIPSAWWFAHTRARFGRRVEIFTDSQVVRFILLLLPVLILTRLLVMHDTNWRLALWAYGVVSAAICALWFALLYRRPVGEMAFPACFTLVAIPWPTFLESSLVDAFTRTVASVITFALQWHGAAAQHTGHSIELRNAMIKVGEACSGIRSFQALFALALFLGEAFLLRRVGRLWMLPAALGAGIILNMLRALALAFLASRLGINAEQWHDAASVLTTGAGFAFLYYLASQLEGAAVTTRAERPIHDKLSSMVPLATVAVIAALALPSIYVTMRGTTQSAQPLPVAAVLEDNLSPRIHALAPTDEDTFMRADRSLHGIANVTGGSVTLFYYEWSDPQFGMFRAMGHTPDYCMGCRGADLVEPPSIVFWNAPGAKEPLPLEFYRFRYGSEPDEIHVFRLVWNGGFVNSLERNTHSDRLRNALLAARPPRVPVHLFYAGLATRGNPRESLSMASEALGMLVSGRAQRETSGR